MTGPFLYLPSGQLVMCGWSQASPCKTSQIWSIFCQQPPISCTTFCSCHLSIFTFSHLLSHEWSPQLTVAAGAFGASQLLPPSVGRLGHRAVDGQSHVTVWGPQTLDGSCLWHKQALTATLTTIMYVYWKHSYIYIVQVPHKQPGDNTETKHAQTKSPHRR